MTSFGVVELIQTCVASFVGPTMLGVMVLRDILAEMGNFSTFSCFWVKPTIVDRVSRADVIGNNASKFNEWEMVLTKKNQRDLVKFRL